MSEMPELIKGFSQVEYLTVFNAIIFGFVGAEFYAGWGSMIRNRSHIKNYWQHVLWTLLAFTLYIQNWYGIWPRIEFINVNVFYFVFSLAPIFVFHVIGVILFPDFSKPENEDLKKYHFENIKYLYILFGAYLMLAIANSVVYPDKGNVLLQTIIRVVGITLCVLAIIFQKYRVIHAIFLIIGCAAAFVFLMALPS